MSDLTYLDKLISGQPGPPGPPGPGGGGDPLTDVAFVDAAFVGTSTGGIGAPFATVAAAIVALGGTGTIILAPGQYAEAGIAVPSGSKLTISSLETTSIPPTIVHQMLWTVGDDDELHISGINLPSGLALKDADAGTGDVNLRLDSLTCGAITNGNSGAAAHTHVITLTSTARAYAPTDNTTLGTVNVNGPVYSTNTILTGNIICSGLFGNYAFLSNGISVTAAGNCVLKNSELGAIVTIALGGSGSTLFVDETTNYFTGGLVLTGTGANKVIYAVNQSDHMVLTIDGDTTPGYLFSKIQAGSGITAHALGPGDTKLEIAAAISTDLVALDTAVLGGDNLTGALENINDTFLTIQGEIDALSAPARFGSTFYVDPDFTGTSNGSDSNPYKSITAAIGAAPSAGALIIMAPYAVSDENVTFPAGGVWEVQSAAGVDSSPGNINGNIVISAGAVATIVTLTNLTVSGTTLGSIATAAHNFLILNNSTLTGAVSLANPGSGYWTLDCLTAGVASAAVDNGSFGSSVAIGGELLANGYRFQGGISFTVDSKLTGCLINTSSIHPNGNLLLEDTTFGAAPIFTGSAAVVVDGYSHASAVAAGGITLAGGATLTIRNDVALAGIQQGGATSGQALAWSGTAWSPTTVTVPATDGVTLTGTSTFSIKNGGVSDAQVNASAAIAGTKISPDFGSQDLKTTGVISFGAHPSTTGTIQLSDDSAGILARDASHTVDISLLSYEPSLDILQLGVGDEPPGTAILNAVGEVRIQANNDVSLSALPHHNLSLFKTTSSAALNGMVGGGWMADQTSAASSNPTDGLFFWSGAGALTTQNSSGQMVLGDGSRQMFLNGVSGASAYPITLQLDGNTVLEAGPTSLNTFPDTFVFQTTGHDSKYFHVADNNEASVSCGSLNIKAQSTTGSGSTGGWLDLGAGDGPSPGHLQLHGGFGSTASKHGNVAIGSIGAGSWQSMALGVFIQKADTAPTGNPSNGFFLYIDPSDSKLKVRGSSGTVTTLGNP